MHFLDSFHRGWPLETSDRHAVSQLPAEISKILYLVISLHQGTPALQETDWFKTFLWFFFYFIFYFTSYFFIWDWEYFFMWVLLFVFILQYFLKECFSLILLLYFFHISPCILLSLIQFHRLCGLIPKPDMHLQYSTLFFRC